MDATVCDLARGGFRRWRQSDGAWSEAGVSPTQLGVLPNRTTVRVYTDDGQTLRYISYSPNGVGTTIFGGSNALEV